MGFLSGGLGAIVGGVSNLIGGALDSHNDRKMARMGYDFQREVFQNQYQWKAADAKKAGLHPLAVLGGGSYSGSPVSTGGTNYASALGKLGEGIGDAVTAYMSRDEIAAEKAKADAKFSKELDLLDAQIQEIRARTKSYSVPMANGTETIKGQTDAVPASGAAPDNTFGPKSFNLMSIARHGDILLTALNPDIADSLTESQLAHASAVLTREVEAGRNPKVLRDAIKHLPKVDQLALVDGRATLDYVPAVGGYVLTYRKKYHRDRRGYAHSVSGALRF